ncbi:protein HUA2-LIKE 3 isoform X2 [Gossypium hirsutum]|uniref:Protein HUA2-LIKE 3 isoform X2 n=1 Tax=Gossypium hirsutum TaxID=3635 RepID=A0A1U8K621_GOSHI|nr:protein HUA2-LIKE 3 isoform X2 [Gossypium hirsutum]
MAPSRRKSASKAAAAAAARRQWKVGDLVLAKVKGFPAWPATVSEPEKWGYSSDWKKVMVYFFGTQQIAFCNPADVEAFTEEKKQSLLTKRQGKGADFVRAVQEIIDSYEKSKKRDQVDNYNSADGVTQANCGNSGDSSVSKDVTDTCEATEIALADARIDALHEKESVSEQPLDTLLVKEEPILTTYSSRKRSGSVRCQKSIGQQKASPVQRGRSSTRVESSRFQNFMMSSNDGRCVSNVSANVIQNGSQRRKKQIRKSTDASECDDVDLPVLMLNGRIDENGSDIATFDSDAGSFNDGSSMDCSCKPEHPGTVVECLEGDAELSNGLDFQIKALVIKRKRKPFRKLVNIDPAEPLAESDLSLGISNTRQNLQNTCDNLNERYSKDDGDEHLPLLKRARVRMGKLLAADEFVSSSRMEEKPISEGTVNLLHLQQMSPSSSDNDSPTERDSLLLKGALINVSPSKGDSEVQGSRLESLKVLRNQLGCLAGGEAALPPSKRLHRALEAMSANAADEDQAIAELSATMKTLDDESHDSLLSSHVTVEDKEANVLEEHGRDLIANSDSGMFFVSNSMPSDKFVESSVEPLVCCQPVKSPKNQKHVLDEDVFVEPMNHVSCNTHNSQCLDHSSPNPEKSQASFRSNCGSLYQKFTSNDDLDAEPAGMSNFGAENPDEQFNTSEHADMSSDPVTVTGKTCEVSPQDGSKSEPLKSQINDSSLVNSMHEVEEEFQPEMRQKTTSSLNLDDNSDKDVAGAQLSPCSADGVDSPARVSPSNASLCHVSTSDSASIVHSNGYCSPNVHLCPNKVLCVSNADDEAKADSVTFERPKSVSKCSTYTDAQAVLLSFENMLVILTRTKESIARATRIAIDCAKFGVSANKVVEIIARNLERESSLHKRVDLFFLVDSITQCSRGLKGDVGDIYPSAIQAALPRLLNAAAPPGPNAQENHRQCLKVLRLWLERRILPESVVRHHIRELDSLSVSSSGGVFSRRSARTERALDDPIRDMEGMLVDEYGSNSSFQLPGFCMPRMLNEEDEGSDSDGESFEAVTPEHYSGGPEEQEANPASEKRRHILEDVDGELEMEDVAPEIEMSSTSCATGINTAQTLQEHCDQHFPLPFAPPLPHDVHPSSPPLPSSPPPPPPPPPPLPPPIPRPISGPYTNNVDSTIHTSIQAG